MVYGFSALIFILFILGIINLSDIKLIFYNLTGYFLNFSFSDLDCLLISIIPIFGMYFNSKLNYYKTSKLIKDVLIISFFPIVSTVIGLCILLFVGKPSNPLVPQNLLTQPFPYYSTFLLSIGIITPFLFRKHNVLTDEINEIGVKN